MFGTDLSSLIWLTHGCSLKAPSSYGGKGWPKANICTVLEQPVGYPRSYPRGCASLCCQMSTFNIVHATWVMIDVHEDPQRKAGFVTGVKMKYRKILAELKAEEHRMQ